MLQPTEDETFVVDAVTRFAEARIEPSAEAWDRDAAFMEGLGPELAELGLTTLLLDEARGGTGLPFDVAVAAVRALARADASLAWVVAVHNLALRAAPEALDLGPYTQGERWLTVAALPGVASRGAPTGPSSVVTCAFAPTHVAIASDGGVELVPFEPARASSIEPALGLRAARLAQAELAPPPALASDALRLATAVALGIGTAALDAAVAYAREREQFGRPIADFQGLQFRLADRATELEAADALSRWVSVEGDSRRAGRAALLAMRAAKAAANDALQILGGVGFVREYPVERRLRDALALEGLLVRPTALRAQLAGELSA